MGARRLAGWTAAALLTMPAAAVAAPASPDPGYGAGGVVTGFPATAAGMTLDGAGRAVIAATGVDDARLLRLAPNGATEFSAVKPLGSSGELAEVVQRADGGYVGGWIEPSPGSRRFAIVPFTATGQPGEVVSDTPGGGADEIHALAVQPDGRIVAAGRSGSRIGVVRYSATGTAEAAFPRVHDFSSVTGEEAGGAVVEPGGRIVLAGTGVLEGERRFLLAALTPAGLPDTSFGAGGLVTLDVGDGPAAVYSLARQPDGKLLVAGTTDGTGAGGGIVARFLPDGTPDSGFSTDGIARLGVPSAAVDGVALQPDGKIVVAGAAGADAIVGRFRPGGARDPGFGTDGVARRSFGSGADRLTGVGVAADGGIVAGGLGSGSVVATRLVGGDSSDPALAMTAESLGDLVTFTVTATNPGADAAQDVSVNVTPPGALAAAALTTAGGACAGTSCSLGTLPAGATRRMNLLARAQAPGPLSATARISSTTFDSDTGNNAAGATGTATANRVVRPDRTSPKVKLRLRAKRIRQIGRRVRLAITTSEAATVVVRTRWVKDGKARTFAETRTVVLRKKGTKTARLSLTRPARQLVKRKRTRRLNLAVTARARDRAGNKRKKTLQKTLRR
jgi:uncharacterized delta-60 repeat protein/uncharacterized repeat protein (TIGR01451 family)